MLFYCLVLIHSNLGNLRAAEHYTGYIGIVWLDVYSPADKITGLTADTFDATPGRVCSRVPCG